MSVTWPVGVNQKAYGMDSAPGDNIERVEFESGKARTFQKNSINKKRHSFMLDMIDDGASSEYRTFVTWWDYNLASGTLSFLFPDLITHSGDAEYRPTGQYSAVGQKHKEVTIEVEEM